MFSLARIRSISCSGALSRGIEHNALPSSRRTRSSVRQSSHSERCSRTRSARFRSNAPSAYMLKSSRSNSHFIVLPPQFFVDSVHRGLQFFSCTVNTRAHRTHGYIQYMGDLIVRQPVNVKQEEDFLVMIWYLLQGPRDETPDIFRDEMLNRILVLTCDRFP